MVIDARESLFLCILLFLGGSEEFERGGSCSVSCSRRAQCAMQLHAATSSFHGLPTVQNVRRYPSLGEVLLQPRHLGQTTRSLDSRAHSPLLVVRVDAIFAVRLGAVCRRHHEALGLDAHDLGRQLGGLVCCPEQLRSFLALHVFDFGEVEVAHRGAAPDHPVTVVLHRSAVGGSQCVRVHVCTYLLCRHRVANRRQKYQLLESSERVQIRKLCETVLRQDQCLQVGNARGEIRLQVRDAILPQEERAKAGLERKVAELCDVIVGQIDCVVVLCFSSARIPMLYMLLLPDSLVPHPCSRWRRFCGL